MASTTNNMTLFAPKEKASNWNSIARCFTSGHHSLGPDSRICLPPDQVILDTCFVLQRMGKWPAGFKLEHDTPRRLWRILMQKPEIMPLFFDILSQDEHAPIDWSAVMLFRHQGHHDASLQRWYRASTPLAFEVQPGESALQAVHRQDVGFKKFLLHQRQNFIHTFVHSHLSTMVLDAVLELHSWLNARLNLRAPRTREEEIADFDRACVESLDSVMLNQRQGNHPEVVVVVEEEEEEEKEKEEEEKIDINEEENPAPAVVPDAPVHVPSPYDSRTCAYLKEALRRRDINFNKSDVKGALIAKLIDADNAATAPLTPEPGSARGIPGAPMKRRRAPETLDPRTGEPAQRPRIQREYAHIRQAALSLRRLVVMIQ